MNSFWDNFLPRRLGYQLALLIALLVAGGFALFTWHAIEEQNKVLDELYIPQASVLAKNVAATGDDYLFATYHSELEQLLFRSAEYPGVAGILVTNPEGDVLLEVKRDAAGNLHRPRYKRQLKLPGAERPVQEIDGEHIVAWHPMINGFVQGWVRVTLSTDVIVAHQDKLLWNNVTDGVIGIGIVLTLLLLFLRRPLRALLTTADFAARLDELKGEQIEVLDSTREIQTLQFALNKTSRKLRHQEDAIVRSIRAWENQKFALDEHSIVSVADISGRITYANEKFCAVSGYREDELLGRDHRILNSGNHPRTFFEEMWIQISQGQVWHGIICNRAKDGCHYWVNTTIVPFIGADGLPSEYVSIRTDITEMVRTSDALRESRERLRLSQKFANIGTWDWDVASGNLYCSEQIPPMFGYRQENFTPSYGQFMLLVHPEDRRRVLESVEHCLVDKLDYDIEHRVVWRDGQVRWVHGSGNAVRDRHGNAIRMVGILQDITERVHTQQALRDSEEMNRHSQKMQAIGTLAGGIAHDFNNILYAVLGNAELIEMDAELDSEIAHSAKEIIRASERARDLINQILAFSRKSHEQTQSIQPKLIVKEALKLMRASIPSTIYVKSNITSPDYVRIEPTQIHQIVMNLCVNAYHAIDAGEGEILIELESVTLDAPLASYNGEIAPGDYVCLRVTDSGHGIEAENLSRIFEPFFTTKEVGKGTGMGLAALHGIVGNAGGGICVESAPGEGARFEIYLPVDNALEQQEPSRAIAV